MKYRRIVTVRLLSTVISVSASVAAAMAGWGYWALVVQPVALAVCNTIFFWFAMPWMPGRPRRCEDLAGMLGFGGALTVHGMVGYLANNLDNILIGRFWGDRALGLYSTSYGLMMRPISLAGYGVGEAAIPAMSRAATPGELKATFRRMFELTCLLGLPICVAGAIWTTDVVLTLLGPQWVEAVPVLRWLFIAALPRMLGVCTGWVYVATGRPGRMLTWQVTWTPLIALAFVLGLSHGAVGVAAAYAIVNWLGIVPNYLYCFSGTSIELRDVAASLIRPLACTVLSVAAATALVWVMPGIRIHEAGPLRLSMHVGLAVVAYGLLVTQLIPFVRERVAAPLRRVSQAGRSA
jgi:PST family polysaccharide transporter